MHSLVLKEIYLEGLSSSLHQRKRIKRSFRKAWEAWLAVPPQENEIQRNQRESEDMKREYHDMLIMSTLFSQFVQHHFPSCLRFQNDSLRLELREEGPTTQETDNSGKETEGEFILVRMHVFPLLSSSEEGKASHQQAGGPGMGEETKTVGSSSTQELRHRLRKKIRSLSEDQRKKSSLSIAPQPKEEEQTLTHQYHLLKRRLPSSLQGMLPSLSQLEAHPELYHSLLRTLLTMKKRR